MITLGIINIKVEIFVLLTFLIVLAIQLLLCYKVKFRIIRLLPVGIFAVLTVSLAAIAFSYNSGWDALGYLLLAIYTSLLLAACGSAWAVWAIVRKIKSRK